MIGIWKVGGTRNDWESQTLCCFHSGEIREGAGENSKSSRDRWGCKAWAPNGTTVNPNSKSVLNSDLILNRLMIPLPENKDIKGFIIDYNFNYGFEF